MKKCCTILAVFCYLWFGSEFCRIS